MHLSRHVFALAVLSFAACGGNGPSNPNPNDGVDNFTAKIDGVDWNAEFPVSAINPQPGMYSITALRATGSNPYTMIMMLNNIPGVGSYRLGVNTMMYGGTALVSLPTSGGWSTALDGRAGTIDITTLTADKIAGTFEFVAQPQGASPGIRTVTEGEFDIPVSGTGGPAPADQGSIFTASIDGEVFHGGTLAWEVVSDMLVIAVNDGTINLTFTIAEMTASDTYDLSSDTPKRTITMSGLPTDLSTWSSDGSGGHGSVTLNLNGGRISGSFSADLIGMTGGATGEIDVSGTFVLGEVLFASGSSPR